MLYVLCADHESAIGLVSRTLCWVIKKATRSEIVHCAIGDDRVVLEQTRAGTRLVEFHTYTMHYPGLRWIVEVPGTPGKPIECYADDKPGYVRPILSWISRGAVSSRDCVQSCRTVLAAAGVQTPRSITTPAALLSHLRSRGFHAVPTS